MACSNMHSGDWNGCIISRHIQANCCQTGDVYASALGFFRALDKKEYLVIIRDNSCKFCIKTYVVTPHLNRLSETVQMRGHNIWFR